MDTSIFAQTIINSKYAHVKSNGNLETWNEIANRVATHVLGAIHASKETINEVAEIISKKQFIPAGRYLYAAGRPFHQCNNCLTLIAEDSREGWSDLLRKASMALMTGAGIGVSYSKIRGEGIPINKTGGYATGPLALMQMVNEVSRGVMQGGARRSAVLSLLSWKHPDIYKFIEIKNWDEDVKTLKAKNFNFPAPLDGTNISVHLDDEFFKAFNNQNHKLNSHAISVYWATVRSMLKSGEPGFSIDIGDNKDEIARNAPITGNTYVLTSLGYKKTKELIEKEVIVWTGKQWATTVFKKTRNNDPILKITLTGKKEIRCSKDHPFILPNGDKIEASKLSIGIKVTESFEVVYDGIDSNNAYLLGVLYGDGWFNNKNNRAEVTLCGKKKLLFDKLTKADVKPGSFSQTSKNYLRVYYYRNELFTNRDKSVFPDDVLAFNYKARLEFLAGLLDTDGNDHNGLCRLSSTQLEFLQGVRRLCNSLGLRGNINIGSKGSYKGTPTYMLLIGGECSKIPTIRCKFNDSNRDRYGSKVISVTEDGNEDVYCCDVEVEEHSFIAEGIVISNCSEYTSSYDSNICNLGSINLARINSLEEMKKVTELGTMFLVAGSVYSDVPYEEVKAVKEVDRRIGLGLMGLHEWLLVKNKKYDIDEDLSKYLDIYKENLDIANKYANKWSISKVIKARALAPTGTISIVAETTSGIEPLFCTAYKRRYRKGTDLIEYQYVLDPTAKRLVDKGLNPDAIEDAYSLAEDVERRVKFQSWIQTNYIDMGVSSTINLPSFGTPQNNHDTITPFGNMLFKYLPKLRGITTYPANSRGAQPLTPVHWHTAVKHVGQVFIEGGDVCSLKGGSCNS